MTYLHTDGRFAAIACSWRTDPDMGQPTDGYLVLTWRDATQTGGWVDRYEFTGREDNDAILARLGPGWRRTDA
jgi:hypothetical protein